MITFEQAEEAGYAFFEVDHETYEVIDGEGNLATVRSDCPRFFALRLVAGLLDDELGTLPVTAELVQWLTGERLSEGNTDA